MENCQYMFTIFCPKCRYLSFIISIFSWFLLHLYLVFEFNKSKLPFLPKVWKAKAGTQTRSLMRLQEEDDTAQMHAHTGMKWNHVGKIKARRAGTSTSTCKLKHPHTRSWNTMRRLWLRWRLWDVLEICQTFTACWKSL